MESNFLIYAVGFLAQIFFSARILVQWIMSERAKKVLSPSIFWILSLAGSYLLFFYGWLRNDFAIILGQIISYYIYIWNVNKKGIWNKMPAAFQVVLVCTPIVAVGFMLKDFPAFVEHFFKSDSIPLWLIIFGSLGQIIFTLRFIYQWSYSRKKDESVLPKGFWIISLIGSFVIVIYAIIRKDPVLILGQSTGVLAYTRNLWLLCHESHETDAE